MKFKKIFYITSLATTLCLLNVSCSNEYLETKPSNEIPEGSVFTTPENLMSAINGMHRNMYRRYDSQGQNGYTAQLIIFDVMGDDLIFPSEANGWFVSDLRWLQNQNESSATTAYVWNFWYSMIKNANNLIVKGEKVVAADADGIKLKNSAIAQAYAYRAFGYFQLVQTYAKAYGTGNASSDLGVVIRLDADDESPKARATVQEVYDLINDDLAQAETLMSGIRVANNSHISLSTIKGIAARVALVQKDYSLAANKANEARASHVLMSNAQYKQGFNDYYNPEWMWGASIIADQSDYFGNFMAYMSRNYSSTQIRSCPKIMNQNLYNFLSDDDVRKAVVDKSGDHANLELPSTFAKFPYTSQKFLAQSTSVSLGDVPFMRAAEMYLIEAEALYNLGDEGGSKAVLQELLDNRTNNTYTISTSGQAYYDEILKQRRAELWGEGFRFYDLKRLGQPLDRSISNIPNGVESVYSGGVTNVLPTSSLWQWPIPRQELNTNPLLVQNPFE